jgi:hypothetical protein
MTPTGLIGMHRKYLLAREIPRRATSGRWVLPLLKCLLGYRRWPMYIQCGYVFGAGAGLEFDVCRTFTLNFMSGT